MDLCKHYFSLHQMNIHMLESDVIHDDFVDLESARLDNK